MKRRSRFLLSLALAVGAAVLLAPTAGAQVTPGFSFEHDDSIETTSGFYGLAGSDRTVQPDQQEADLLALLDSLDADNDFTPPPAASTREVFEFEVPAGSRNGSFTVQLNWGNPRIDFDLYVYRQNPDGTVDPDPVAQSATADPEENAMYVSPVIDNPVEAGTYVIYVMNWCSSDTDPVTAEVADVNGIPDPADVCGIGPYADEDDFTGRVEFQPLVLSNRLPTNVRVTGPTSGRTGDRLTFTASATDPDGRIVRYGFDLDGDGNFEYDSAGNPSVTKLFDQPGTFDIGVRVVDDRGGVAYGSTTVTITGPPLGTQPGAGKPVSARNLLAAFRLGSPVFGGRSNRPLRIAYRLRNRATVSVVLYRGAGKQADRMRRLARGVRRANRTYVLRLSSRKLERGTYTIRIIVRTSDGRRKVANLVARRL